MTPKQDIREISSSEVKQFLTDKGEKAFRAKQIDEWLWAKGARSFEQMTNLSKGLRAALNEHFSLHSIEEAREQKSSDKTIKTAYRLHDGALIESVLIPSRERMTACISSQVGCAMGCNFCATGQMKYVRDLTAGEIFDQVVATARLAGREYTAHLANVVLMGMGEPLLNYDNVLRAIEKMTSEKGLAMSPRRITLSTAGIIKGIRRLADDQVRFGLAVSIHTANEEKRTRLMPLNKSNPLSELSKAVRYFYEKTQSRVTFEYLLLGGFNDSREDAKELAEFCKIVPCKVNLIEYNPVPGLSFKKPQRDKTTAFLEFLQGRNMIANLRFSKGADIDAACGQLANRQ